MKNIKNSILCALLLACLPACEDTFNTHYSEETGVAPKQNLWQLIEQESDLSVFAEMLRKTGYDALLSRTQAFSVWAPTNLALQGVDTTDVKKMKDIVLTHIARFQYAAGNERDRLVLTLNDKRIHFVAGGDRYTMNDSELLTTNQLANNGILHTMKEQVPFVKNLWEYLSEPGMDSIRNYFDAFHLKVFIPGSSKEIDYVDGMAVYDSVFVETNELFYQGMYGVGFLNNEDSLYTMILPNNTAWIKAYDQRKPYFETHAPNADSVQHWNTQYSIVQDLVFRGSIDAPGQLDTIVSTRSNVFRDPAGLFPAGPASPASNGLVYITDELKHNYWESWQHPLQIEAERSQLSLVENGITSTPANVKGFYFPEYEESIPSKYCVLISNGSNSVSGTTFLLFHIPNTLKAEYSVSAVFAPIRYAYPNFSAERTKIRFDIQQLDRSTIDQPVDKQVWKSLIGVAPGGSGVTPPDNETDSATVKKIFLTNITFPEANYKEETATIRIKLISRLTTADVRAGYNNRMLLDYLLLEPVH